MSRTSSDLQPRSGRPLAAALTRWHGLSLLRQFTVVTLVVLGCGMALLGLWVSSRIEAGVVHNAAMATALYMDNFVEPHVQELAGSTKLSPAGIDALDALRQTQNFTDRIAAMKVWVAGGRLAYSTRKNLIGENFPLTRRLETAWAGKVAAEFSPDRDEENEAEIALGIPLLEVYAPLHENGTGRVIAVGEFYVKAPELRNDLLLSRLESWAAVGAGAVVMFAALFGLMREGSRTIEAQQRALQARVAELPGLIAQNAALLTRVGDADRRTAEMNERALRRVGAELHDGLAQLVALSLMRLDSLAPRLAPASRQDPKGEDMLEILRTILQEAMGEIRNLSAGLILPELQNVPLADVIDMAATTHERRTGTKVARAIDALPQDVPMALKTCLYRFVQEGLNNAYRHAGGLGQTVGAHLDGAMLLVDISDNGGGLVKGAPSKGGSGMGLASLRERILSLGGKFEIHITPGVGTRLSARFDDTAWRMGS